MDLVKTNIHGLVRDTRTKTVINTNMDGYQNILRERERAQEMSSIKNDIETMKVELGNVKTLLNEIAFLVKR